MTAKQQRPFNLALNVCFQSFNKTVLTLFKRPRLAGYRPCKSHSMTALFPRLR